jgi:hypothetical protein
VSEWKRDQRTLKERCNGRYIDKTGLVQRVRILEQHVTRVTPTKLYFISAHPLVVDSSWVVVDGEGGDYRYVDKGDTRSSEITNSGFHRQ